MHAPTSAKHDSETTGAGTDKDEASSTRCDTVNGNDALARRAPASEGQSGGRQAASTISTGADLGSGVPASMRSRVTVVCAECKKQKLKCDRRIPCESCTKRNTIARCIYNPAAIEKVDVTSINNRLRVVEGNLSALGVSTPGYLQLQAGHQMQINSHLNMQQMQNPLGILPAMGGAGLPLPGVYTSPFPINSSAQHNTHTSVAAHDSESSMCAPRILALANDARGASIMAPLDGVPAIWVREIAAETGHECSLTMLQSEQGSRSSAQFLRSASGNVVSCKGLSLDLQPVDRESTSSASTFGFGRSQGFDAKQRLALHSGLGLPPSSGGVSGNQPGRMGEGRPSADVEMIDPVADMYTPLAAQLLSQFPSQRTRCAMLSRLGAANLTEGMSCVPFPVFCASVETVCAGASGKGKGTASGSAGSSTPAFSKIAEAAVGLAIGALIWTTEPSTAGRTNDEAIDRKGPRATPIMIASAPPMLVPDASSSFPGDSSRSSTDEVDVGEPERELERPDVTIAYALYRLAHLALAMHTARHGHAARDPALIHTYTLSAHYLLLTQSTSSEFPDAILPAELPSLVGSLIWEARAMGLGVDPDEFDPLDDVQRHSGMRPAERSDGFGDFVKREEEDEGSESRQKGKGMSLFMKEVRRRLWWSVVWLDLLVSDTYGYNTTILPGEYTTRLPANVDDSCFHTDSLALPAPDDSSPERNNTFCIVKLRLLEIYKHAPARAFRSGLAPTAGDPDSAATAAAQRLADEITQWMEDLPERFKLDASDEDFPPVPSSPLPMTPLLNPSATESQPEKNPARTMLIAQRCDLAFHAYHTIMRLFTPTIRSPISRQGHGFPWPGSKTMSPSWHFVGLRAIEPALTLVHAAQMHMIYAPHAPHGTYHMYIFARRLFDAAVVLAYVAIQQPLYTSPVVIEAVRTALGILSHIPARGPTQGGVNASRKTEAECIVGTLLKRAEKARTRSTPIKAGVKRKLEDVESETNQFEGPFRFPFLGSGIVNAYIAPIEEASSRDTNTRAEVSLTSSHQSASVYTCTRPDPLNDGPRLQGSTNMSMLRRADVPAVSIRQRMRDRRGGMNSLDTSHAGFPPVGSDFHVSPPYIMPPQPHPIPDLHSQFLRIGPSVSPSLARFASESTSANPISPFQRHRANNGARSVNIASDPSFREASFAIPASHPLGAVPLQRLPPFSSASYQYPVPDLTGPSYSSPLPLQQQQAYETSMAGNSPVDASGLGGQNPGLNATYSSPVDSMGSASDGTSIARTVPSSATFHNQRQGLMDALPPHPTGVYPPMQHVQVHAQQNQPMPWNGGENTNFGPLAPPWDAPSTYMNWNHDAQ